MPDKNAVGSEELELQFSVKVNGRKEELPRELRNCKVRAFAQLTIDTYDQVLILVEFSPEYFEIHLWVPAEGVAHQVGEESYEFEVALRDFAWAVLNSDPTGAD